MLGEVVEIRFRTFYLMKECDHFTTYLSRNYTGIYMYLQCYRITSLGHSSMRMLWHIYRMSASNEAFTPSPAPILYNLISCYSQKSRVWIRLHFPSFIVLSFVRLFFFLLFRPLYFEPYQFLCQSLSLYLSLSFHLSNILFLCLSYTHRRHLSLLAYPSAFRPISLPIFLVLTSSHSLFSLSSSISVFLSLYPHLPLFLPNTPNSVLQFPALSFPCLIPFSPSHST